VRNDVFQFVCSGSEDQNRELEIAEVLLISQAFVHGDKNIELPADQGEQLPILFAIPPHLPDGFDVVSAQHRG
jgi:hypothetical protein